MTKNGEGSLSVSNIITILLATITTREMLSNSAVLIIINENK